MILIKNSNFLHGLFLLKIGPEMMFNDVLDRKEAFLDNKNVSYMSQKSEIFQRGKPMIWTKIRTFFMVCFY